MDKSMLLVKEIHGGLSRISSDPKGEKCQNLFSHLQKVMGVTNPELKQVIKELKNPAILIGMNADWIDLCKALVATEIFECQVLAFEMIGRDRKLLNALKYRDLTDLGQNLDNWASVDHYTVGIYGVLWGREWSRMSILSSCWNLRISGTAGWLWFPRWH